MKESFEFKNFNEPVDPVQKKKLFFLTNLKDLFINSTDLFAEILGQVFFSE